MPERFHVGTAQPLNVLGSGRAARVTNANLAGTLYLGGPAVSSTTNSYSVAAGASRLVNGPVWGVGSVKIDVVIEDSAVRAASITPETRFWAGGIAPLKAASGGGTNTTVTANTAYLAAINIDQRCVLTGIGFLIGTTGGTHKALAVLYDSTGKALAWSAIAGVTVGTANTYQSLPFTAPYEILTTGRYFVGIAYSGTTPTLQVQDGSAGTAGATSVIGGSHASATDFVAVPTNVTAPTAVGAFPVAFTY